MAWDSLCVRKLLFMENLNVMSARSIVAVVFVQKADYGTNKMTQLINIRGISLCRFIFSFTADSL